MLLVESTTPAARVDLVRETFSAELADLNAEVIVILVELADASPAGWEAEARRLAREQDARLAVWFVPAAEGSVVLHTLDPRRQRPNPRPVGAVPGNPDAMLDTMATITRAALVTPLPDPPVETRRRAPPDRVPETPRPPPPQTPPVSRRPTRPPPTPPRHHARVAVDYLGNHLATTVPWQSGVFISAAWLSPRGLYIGAGYQAVAPIGVQQDIPGPPFITGAIRRHPTHLTIGYHRVWSFIGFEADASLVLDPITMNFNAHCETGADESGLCPDNENDNVSYDVRLETPTLFGYGFAPRLRVIIKPTPIFGLHFGGGVDVFSDTALTIRCTANCAPLELPLLTPYNVRPVFQGGLVFFL
ncbi:MAG: hypothetical protein H6713_26590 [Myxococcales bacterium]|nr:hypothetical protein [Myxococcales bacterium]